MKNARVRNRGRGGKHNLARDKATADALLDLCTTYRVRQILNPLTCAYCGQAFDHYRRLGSFAIADLAGGNRTAYVLCRECAGLLESHPQQVADRVEQRIAEAEAFTRQAAQPAVIA